MIQALLISFLVYLCYQFYKKVTKDHDYFEKRNVKHLKPRFLVGNSGGNLINKYTVAEYAKKLYDTFPDEPIVGMFNFLQPQYVIRDPNIIKQIAIKDFDHFVDHLGFGENPPDKMWGNNLFLMRGEKWRNMRATLSPAFTGRKMRQMYELVVDSADEVVKYLKKEENGESIEFEMKDFFSRYTNDVIASCAYGLKVNSLAEPDNEFYRNAKTIISLSGLVTLSKMIMTLMCPRIARLLNISIADKSIANEFKQTILETMNVRKKNNIHRPDMINILMQVREGTLSHQADEENKGQEGFATVDESDVGKVTVNRKWNDDEIVAQCFVFLVAGFDSSSTLLSFAAYELAKNPDVQQKLFEEIKMTDQQLNGKRISYETLQKMKYLDQIICETLRLWAPNLQIDRLCSKDYDYDDGNLKFRIEKNTPLVFAIYGIHHDAKYFAEPNKFDPERFSDVNKGNIIPGTFIPFGVGPRNCIGSRFALMEVKAILFYLLLNFSFEPNEKTQIPVELVKSFFRLEAKNGIHLQLKLRKKC